MRTRLYVANLVSQLYTLDPATGSAGLVGPTSVAQITDIAFHGPTLYAVSFPNFYRLDPNTGAATLIGATGFPATNGLAVSEEGIIYAASANKLITINPVTGHGTLVGTFGAGLASSGDLVLDANGVLYGALYSGSTGYLARIDRNTGAASIVGPTGFSDLYGLAIHCCRFFGCTYSGHLLSLSAATGAGTIIGSNSVQMGGMSSQCCCDCC